MKRSMTSSRKIVLSFAFVSSIIFCATSQESPVEKDKDIGLKRLSADEPSGHSFVRFGRGKEDTRHSYIYFGKRSPQDSNIADLFQYLQRSQEPSWKRGHSIMRFGKRSDRHNFIRFGKKDFTDAADAIDPNEKQPLHAMLYFGKRNYDNNEPQEKRGHSMMYFGKRIPEEKNNELDTQSTLYLGMPVSYDGKIADNKREGHNMLYFGKRSIKENENIDKRPEHSMLYFGKRRPHEISNFEKKQGHSMMYFGKRSLSNVDDYPEKIDSIIYYEKPQPFEVQPEKKEHAMMYFGKRFSDDENKRKATGHSMMYFGKKDDNEANPNTNV